MPLFTDNPTLEKSSFLKIFIHATILAHYLGKKTGAMGVYEWGPLFLWKIIFFGLFLDKC
jgi:hypothetical protein